MYDLWYVIFLCKSFFTHRSVQVIKSNSYILLSYSQKPITFLRLYDQVKEEHKADALAAEGDEGRSNLR